jgi:hypothetical protein
MSGTSWKPLGKFWGYDWEARNSDTLDSRQGAGPNYWKASNVWFDLATGLHLKITRDKDGKVDKDGNAIWYCAEVKTLDRERLTFGHYDFVVEMPSGHRLNDLARYVVLGMFSYPTISVGPDGTHEIDIELWGNDAPDAPTVNYTVWPNELGKVYSQQDYVRKLELDKDVYTTTHRYTWDTGSVLFDSLDGDHGAALVGTPVPPTGDPALPVVWPFEPLDPANQISQDDMPLRFNLWLSKNGHDYGQQPIPANDVEVIIRSFKFTPLSRIGEPVGVPVMGERLRKIIRRVTGWDPGYIPGPPDPRPPGPIPLLIAGVVLLGLLARALGRRRRRQ